jgi:multidrug transporter EmrE-like cation transporter
MAIYLIVLLSVALTASAQILLKVGMSGVAVRQALSDGPILAILMEVVRAPAIIGGFVLYGISVVLWLWILSRLEVSRAYPFVGLGVIITMLFGVFMLGEPLSLAKVVGTILVAAGIYVVASA